jgi:hypothetical protein
MEHWDANFHKFRYSKALDALKKSRIFTSFDPMLNSARAPNELSGPSNDGADISFGVIHDLVERSRTARIPRLKETERMPTLEDAKRRAAFAYNAASDAYDNRALGLWDHFGRKTVEKPNICKGARVLDVCCGSGASANPAAELVRALGMLAWD